MRPWQSSYAGSPTPRFSISTEKMTAPHPRRTWGGGHDRVADQRALACAGLVLPRHPCVEVAELVDGLERLHVHVGVHAAVPPEDLVAGEVGAEEGVVVGAELEDGAGRGAAEEVVDVLAEGASGEPGGEGGAEERATILLIFHACFSLSVYYKL